MSVFKVKKDTGSYSYPIIKIIAFIILIAGSIVVRCSVHIANSGLNTAAGIITVLIVCLSVLCVYLSFAEIIVLHERRKNAKEENGVFSGKTKDVSVTRIVELATENDIIDIRALPYSAGSDMELATMWTVGLAYNHGKTLRVGADFQMQHWGGLQYPDYVKGEDGTADYVMRTGLLRDCQKVNVGGEWTPNPNGRKYLQHVRYRIGAGMTTPYYNINGQKGPTEYHASIGLGIPILNSINNRSMLNISAQWSHRSADNLVTENSFRINVGITFNERWFAKWKVE